MSNAAIPLEAMVKTISPFERNADDKAFQMKVFTVPPEPYTKKIPGRLALALLMIVSYTFLYFEVIVYINLSCLIYSSRLL